MIYENNIQDAIKRINYVIERDGKKKEEFLGEIIRTEEPFKIEMVKVHIDEYGYFLTSLDIWNELKIFLNE